MRRCRQVVKIAQQEAENADRNTEFMKLYFDNDEFRKAVKEAARRRAYRIITDPLREEALARLRAEMEQETGGSGALGSGLLSGGGG